MKKGVRKRMNNFWHHFWALMPKLWFGATITIKITAIAVCLGMIIGMVMALCKLSKAWPLKIISNVYIECLRGTPLYVQILLFHYGMPQVIHSFTGQQFYFDVMTTAIVVCSLNSGAYIAEIFRSGIQSIDKGQMEAARSLGMTHSKAMQYIILPQAVKRVIPPLCNEFIVLLKDTSLLAVIGVTEIMKTGQLYTSKYMVPFPTYIGVACVYLVLTFTISRVVSYIEKKWHMSGSN